MNHAVAIHVMFQQNARELSFAFTGNEQRDASPWKQFVSTIQGNPQAELTIELSAEPTGFPATVKLLRRLKSLVDERLHWKLKWPDSPLPASLKASYQQLFELFSHATVSAKGNEKLIINTTYKCNNHCIFCSIADREIRHGDFERQKQAIDQARERGVRMLDIDGGEPTLYPRLFDLLDYARQAGMETLTITSNGRLLSDPALVEKLAAYPLNLLISLHGANPQIHESLTTQPGSFRQTVRGLMNARKHFPAVGVNTTVTRDNLHELPAMAALLIKLGIKTWNIQYYTPFGEVDPALAPDPYEAGEKISQVIQQAGDRLKILVINLPFCLLPGYERYALQDYYKSVRHMLFVDGEEVNLADFLAEARFKNGKCAHCPYDPVCNGFWDFGPHPDTGRPSRIRLLDVLPGYPCSAKCIFCAVPDEMLEQQLDTEQVKAEISRAMAYGPRLIRFGGGEPTDREDLPELLRYAKSMEPERLSLQTHGFRLADSSYLNSLIDAGVDRFNISVRGADEQTHETLTGVPGSFEQLRTAIRNVAKATATIELELDAILTQQTVGSLGEQVRFFHSLGARRMNVWFVTAQGRARLRWKELVPNMTETARAVSEAARLAETLGFESFRCYYIPYCFFPETPALVWHPLEENALVVTPTSRFTLDRGSLDLGVKTAACERCAICDDCFGIAPSYLEHFGYSELRPFSAPPPGFSPLRKKNG